MKAYGIRMMIAAALAGLLIAGTLFYRSHLQAQAAAQSCASTHKIVSTFQAIIIASSSKKALLKYAYYREHPGEIAAAQNNAIRTAAQLGPADCPPVTTPPKGK